MFRSCSFYDVNAFISVISFFLCTLSLTNPRPFSLSLFLFPSLINRYNNNNNNNIHVIQYQYQYIHKRQEVYIVDTYQELIRHCGSNDSHRRKHNNIRTVRFTVMPMVENNATTVTLSRKIRTMLEKEEHEEEEVRDDEEGTVDPTTAAGTASVLVLKNKNIILDIDLDGYTTTSPGALALLEQQLFPNQDVLSRVYHTIHNNNYEDDPNPVHMYDFNAPQYWQEVLMMHNNNENEIDDGEVDKYKKQYSQRELSYVYGPSFLIPAVDDNSDPLTDPYNGMLHGVYSAEIIELTDYVITNLRHYDKMNQETVNELEQVFCYYFNTYYKKKHNNGNINNNANAITLQREDLVELLDSFLLQPFFVPSSSSPSSSTTSKDDVNNNNSMSNVGSNGNDDDHGTIGLIVQYWNTVLREVFSDGSSINSTTNSSSNGSIVRNYFPAVVNIARSPFYTPDQHLNYIECEVLKGLVGSVTKSNNNSNTDNASLDDGIFGRGAGLYHSDEVDIHRTASATVTAKTTSGEENGKAEGGKTEVGCGIGIQIPKTYNTGENIHIDADNINTDIGIYESFFGWYPHNNGDADDNYDDNEIVPSVGMVMENGDDSDNNHNENEL